MATVADRQAPLNALNHAKCHSGTINKKQTTLMNESLKNTLFHISISFEQRDNSPPAASSKLTKRIKLSYRCSGWTPEAPWVSYGTSTSFLNPQTLWRTLVITGWRLLYRYRGQPSDDPRGRGKLHRGYIKGENRWAGFPASLSTS